MSFQEQVVRRRNVHAGRPVDVECHLVFSFAVHNYNLYFDPRGTTLPPETLSAVERGHVYEAVHTDEGVEIFCGCRIADIETAQLIGGRTVMNLDPDIVTRYKDAPVHNVKSLKYKWRMRPEDYAAFRGRVIDAGGRVDEEDLSADGLSRDVNACLTLLRQVEDKIAAVGEIRLDASPEELERVYRGLAALHDDVDHLWQQSRAVTQRYNRAAKTDDQRIQAEVRLAYSGLAQAVGTLPTHDALKEMEEELLRRRNGKQAQQIIPLSVALARLQAAYPVLAPLHAPGGDQLEIRLGDATIVLRPGSYQVRGDLELSSAEAPISAGAMATGHLFQNFSAVARIAQARGKEKEAS